MYKKSLLKPVSVNFLQTLIWIVLQRILPTIFQYYTIFFAPGIWIHTINTAEISGINKNLFYSLFITGFSISLFNFILKDETVNCKTEFHGTIYIIDMQKKST
jgi:hypothetical protein